MIAVCTAASALLVMMRGVEEQSSGEPLGTDFKCQRRVLGGHETRGYQRSQQQRRQYQDCMTITARHDRQQVIDIQIDLDVAADRLC